LIALLTKSAAPFVQLDEAALTDEQLARRTISFIATKMPHDQVPVEYFGRLVRTSRGMP
jgi:hypothetical protein